VELLFKQSKNPVTLIFASITAGKKGHVFFKSKSGTTLRIKVDPLYSLLFLLNRGWKIVEQTDDHIILKKDVYLKCRYKRGWDLGHIQEIFEDGVYGREPKEYVIDVGASNADSAIFFAARGASKVLALEPDPESYQLTQENIRMNDLQQKVVPLNLALSASDGVAEFLIPNEQPNASTLSPTESLSKVMDFAQGNRVQVNTTTLEALIERYGLPRIDLLKMDCEGCEYSVLRNTKQETFRKISDIILEYHDGPGDLPGLLSHVGFTVKCTATKPLGIIKAHKSETSR
jgi:FkbM family methyltransferase